MDAVTSGRLAPSIRFVYPIHTKPISVTGSQCELNCAHCGGRYLNNMKPLASIADTNQMNTSFLISGGCDHEGRVPIAEYIDALKNLKAGRKFNLHTGLINEDEISAIVEIADRVSFDMVGDDTTIREVFGIDRTVEDYAECYERLRRSCPVVPHICIGLHGGEIKGEYRAMEILSQIGLDELTFIIFTPTRGSRFENCNPPDIQETVKLLSWARQEFSSLPLNLGCMRPGGRYREEIDEWAVRLGLNAIVQPTPKAVRLAKEMQLVIERSEECCAL